MKIGKVSQTVLKRSVLDQFHHTRQELILPLSVEEMCGAIQVDTGNQMVFTEASYYGNEKNLGIFVIAKTVNDLATRGAEPIGVTVSIQLPPYAYESRLKSMIEYINKTCCDQQLQIFSAKAEVNPIIQSTIVHVVALGKIKQGTLLQSSNGKPEQDIILINWIALEGMLRILNEKECALSQRFAPSFLQQTKKHMEKLFAVEEIQLAYKLGASAIHQISSGGILAALWEVAEASCVGLEIELKKIAVKQETIEICECYQMNPYQLTSVGSLLVLVDDGEKILGQLKEKGKQAAWIGRTTNNRDRIICNGDDKRFIDRPQPDELVKLFTQ
ncbi:MAG: AIR synthase-related protein [Lachnospiraceae bacterium]